MPPASLQPPKAGDYFSATLFLAALFHAVVILGVTFTAGEPPADTDDATSLEVVILTGDYEKQIAADDAELLAERSLIGAGNTADDVPLSIAYGDGGETATAGQPQDGADTPATRLPQPQDNDLLLYRRNETAVQQDPETLEQVAQEQQRQGLAGDSNPTEIVAEPGESTVIRSENPRELLISANTRESRMASYLDGWKRKIERVGTMNFPDTSGAQRNPVLEVAISADGELKEVIVQRSSGQKSLDQAAINILRMAAPFDPFPEFLSRDFDVLRFSYEWYFTGDTGGSKLSVAE